MCVLLVLRIVLKLRSSGHWLSPSSNRVLMILWIRYWVSFCLNTMSFYITTLYIITSPDAPH